MSIESPIGQDLHWFIGEDRIWMFTIVNAAGTAQDITGWSLEWRLTQQVATVATALIVKTTGAGITITSGTGGICQVAVNDTDTLAVDNVTVLVPPGTYTHVLRRTDPGNESILAYGDAVVQKTGAA